VRATVTTDHEVDTEYFRFATVQPVGAGMCTLSYIIVTAMVGW
jgi:hypothetical protein